MPDERNAWSAPNPDKICYSCGRLYSRPPDVGCYLKDLHAGGFTSDQGRGDLAYAVARQAEEARVARMAGRPQYAVSPDINSGIKNVNRIAFLHEKIPQLQRKLEYLERASSNKEEAEHVRLAMADLTAELSQLEGRATNVSVPRPPEAPSPASQDLSATSERQPDISAQDDPGPKIIEPDKRRLASTTGNRAFRRALRLSARGARSLALLGLLLAFLAIFLAWFPDGANLLNLYYKNGGFDLSPVTGASSQLVTVAYILYPISLIAAIWAVWTRRSSIWQALLIAPAMVYLAYQGQEGTGYTVGPILTLVAGIVLASSFFASGGSRAEPEYHRPNYDRGYGRGRSGPHIPHIPRRVGAPLWLVVGIWVLLSVGFYSGSLSDATLWYVPALFGVVAGVWLGLRYYFWVARIGNRATLLLVTFGSLVLAIIISGIFLTPYYYATSSFNQFFGIHYSASDIGLASSMAAFGTPLVLFVGFSILYAGYKASRTVFVRYE